MADATVVNTGYGYYVGSGGTDATTVTTQKVQIRGIVCVSSASASNIVVTEVGGTRSLINWVSGPTNRTDTFDMKGLRADGIIVTLATTSADRCIIITE